MWSYLVYSLQHKDLLCSLVCKCKCLCDCGLHNQHWQHSHRDQHISHCDRQELWDTLDLSSIHRVYILHRDFLCVLVDIDTWLCACSQCRKLWCHTVHRDMDPDILFGCKLEWEDTHHHSYNQLIIVKKKEICKTLTLGHKIERSYVLHRCGRDLPHTLAYRCRQLCAFEPCIQHWLHKLWWSRDSGIFL